MEYFSFNGIDSRDINMYIVNDQDGYALTQYLPANQFSHEITRNYIVDNGSYYTERTFSFKVVAETFQPLEYIQDMTRWLETDEYKPLIFSREPYKQFFAKRCGEFTPIIHNGYVVCTLQFIALDYHGYSTFYVSEINEDLFCDSDYENSGIKPGETYVFTNVGNNSSLRVYHGGNNDDCNPTIIIEGTFQDIVLENKTTGERCILNYNLNNGSLKIDCENQTIFKNGSYDVSGHRGSFIKLKGRSSVFPTLLNSNYDYMKTDGYNDIRVTSSNPMDISKIKFDFRFVYN